MTITEYNAKKTQANKDKQQRHKNTQQHPISKDITKQNPRLGQKQNAAKRTNGIDKDPKQTHITKKIQITKTKSKSKSKSQ
jgi:hypothetical protein